MSDLRFTVGNTYTFMRVLFSKGENGFFHRLYVPWNDKLHSIECMELECIEHHKVTDGWSDEKKCDGFIFKAENDEIWENQYPTACYGQLDDTNDRVVFLRIDPLKVWKHDENGEICNDTEGKPIIVDQELHDRHDSTFFEARFELCTQLLGQFYRSINPRERDHSNLTGDEKQQLQTFLDQLIQKVEESSKKKVVFEPLVFNYTDGRPPRISDYYVARVKTC